MDIGSILSINTVEYGTYLSSLDEVDPTKKPEAQAKPLQMKKISEYLEWYLTRNETSFFFNQMETQVEFYYKNVGMAPSGNRYYNLAFDLSIEICTYPEKTLLLRINQNDECDVKFSFDGRLLGILTSREGIVCYDIDQNQEEGKHTGSFCTFCFGNSSDLLAGAYKAGYLVDIWLKQDQAFPTIVGKDSKTITIMCFSNNDKWLCVARDDGDLDIWTLMKNSVQLTHNYPSKSRIFCMCFSVDDKILAFGTNDMSVTIWNFEESSRVHKLKGHKKIVTKILFTPDGKRLITLDGMDYMMIWNIENKYPVTKLIKTNFVSVCSANIIDEELVTIGLDFSFGRWDLHTGKNLMEDEEIAYGAIDLVGSNGNEVAYSYDGSLLAKVNNDPEIAVSLWDTKSGNPLVQMFDLPNDAGYIKDLTFSFDNSLLAICYQYYLYIFNTLENIQDPLHGPLKIKEENSELFAYTLVRFSKAGLLACGTEKGLICIWENPWEAENRKPILLKTQEGVISALQFNSTSEFLATADSIGTIRLWELSSKTVVGEMDKHEGSISWIEFYADNSRMISTGEDNQFIIWELKSHTFVHSFQSQMTSSCPLKMELNQLQNKLIVGYEKGEVEIYVLDYKKASSAYFFHYHSLPIINVRFREKDSLIISQSSESSKMIRLKGVGSPVSHEMKMPIAATSDGLKLISADECIIMIWDAKSGEKLRDLQGHNTPIEFCELASNDRHLASFSEDGIMNIWDMIRGKLLLSEVKMTEKITCARFFNDKIILGSVMGTIYVLQLRFLSSPCTFELLRSTKAHEKEVLCMDVDFSGILATGSKDLKISLWILDSLENFAVINEGIKDEVRSLKFSEMGSYLYGVLKNQQDEEIKMWEVNSGDLVSDSKGEIWKGSRGFCQNERGKRVLTFMNMKKDKWVLETLDAQLNMHSAIKIQLTDFDEKMPPHKIMLSKTGHLICFYNLKVVIYWELDGDEDIFMKTFVRISNHVENPDLFRLKEKHTLFSMDDLGRVYPFLYNILHTMAYTDDYKGKFSDIVTSLKKNDQKMDINGFFEEDIHHRTPHLFKSSL